MNDFTETEVTLRALTGPDFVFESKNDDIKFYLSEQMGNVFIKRSIFVYIEITTRTIKVFTYNIHKTLLTKLHNAIESHIN